MERNITTTHESVISRNIRFYERGEDDENF